MESKGNQHLSIHHMDSDQHQISMSRQQEMQEAQQSQQQFHSLLKEYMEKLQRKKAYFTSFANCLLSFVTAPLMTINTSMQLSVSKNVVTMKDFQIEYSQADKAYKARISSLKPERSLRFAFLNMRNKQSLLKTNQLVGMALPFKPPVYRTYFEAFQGIYKQGISGFYKGNGIRCLHIFFFHKLNTDFTLYSESHYPEQVKRLKEIPLAQEFLLSCAIDFILHPLHVAEARFIMQNRVPNFRVYESLFQFFTKSTSEIFRGIALHIPRNMCIAMTGLTLTKEMDIYTYYGQNILFQTLAYPFLTVQRRLECMSKLGIGLLSNDEYKGFFNACKRIFQEEGFTSFYRGYLAYMLAIMFWMSLLPHATDFMMMRLPLLGDANQQQQQNVKKKGLYDEDEDEDDDEEEP